MSHKILNTGRVLYVSKEGNNDTAKAGDPYRSWSDPWAAAAQMQSGDLMEVFPGTYTIGDVASGADLEVTGTNAQIWDLTNLTKSATESVLHFHFHDGVIITSDSSIASVAITLFSDSNYSAASYGVTKDVTVTGNLEVQVNTNGSFTNDFKQPGSRLRIRLKRILRNTNEPNYWGFFNLRYVDADIEIDSAEGQFLYGYIAPTDNNIINYTVKRAHWYHVGITPWDSHLLMIQNINGASYSGTLNFHCYDFLNESNPSIGSFLGAPLIDYTGGGSVPTVDGMHLNVTIDNYRDTFDYADNATGVNNSSQYAHVYLSGWARSSDWDNFKLNIQIGTMDTGHILFDSRKYGIDVTKLTNSNITVYVKNAIFRSTRVGVLGTQLDLDACNIDINVENAIIKSSVAFYGHGTTNIMSNGTIYRIRGKYRVDTAGSSGIEFSNAAQSGSVFVDDAIIITDGTAFELMSPVAVNVIIGKLLTNVVTGDSDVTEVGGTVIRNTSIS